MHSFLLRSPLLKLARCAIRHYSTPHSAVRSVAILGGGITGLSAAHYLSRLAPSVPITLYEKSDRLGGWLFSKSIDYDGGSVLFEQGPRTLRPWSTTGLVTLELIQALGLENEIAIIPKTSPAAKNRYIYYPDRLNKLPSSLLSLLPSLALPPLRGALSGALREPFQPRRSASLADESIGSFISRRFNPSIAHNIVSAVLHGIYAGDADQLSTRTLMPKMWRDELEAGSVLKGFLKSYEREEDVKLKTQLRETTAGLRKKMEGASVYSFKGGIETLSRALVQDLKARGVEIKTSTPVAKISYTPSSADAISIQIPATATPFCHSHIISTLFAPHTAALLPSALPPLSTITAATVLVVNLFFRTPHLLPITGFGYLIPKSVSLPQNPHRALGVIFDSDASPADAAVGTKVTVMMGGHYWGDSASRAWDEEEAMRMARETLRVQIGVDEEPLVWNVTVQRECIPQYTVGWEDRMRGVREGLERYEGRVAVAGSSYGGVGMNDCVRSARDVVGRLLESGGATGLEGREGRWVRAV